MKNILSKSWIQVLLMGVLIGAAFIIADNKFNFFSKEEQKENYEGPITIEKDKAYFTSATLDAAEFDFGKVKEGDTLTHVFKLTNSGQEPLFVYKTNGSCDCVAALVTKEMIQPGATVEVTTHFNTKGRKGNQKRTLELTCNTEPAQIILTLKAVVE